MTPAALRAFHARHAKKATDLYLKSRTPSKDAAAWHLALREARGRIAEALRESSMLRDVGAALEVSGKHMWVFRHLMAPPTSQDQFKLLCKTWPKSTEKKGGKLSRAHARAASKAFGVWRHKQLTAWLDRGTKPSSRQLRLVLTTVAPLMASQAFATALRNLLAKEQEGAVTALLDANGWTKVPSKLVDKRATLPAKHYMHKTRFATNTSRPQEVDVACGLKDTYVLAMECKVTNDETNSVKRVNDVLKKATAWEAHWGSFVETAALLQGVIAAKDVNRLLDAGVHVFWSHDLKSFKAWVNKRL